MSAVQSAPCFDADNHYYEPRDFCTRRGVSYLMASTQTPVEQLVANYLRKRGLVR